MDNAIRLSEVAAQFSVREDLIHKGLLEWSNINGLKVLHQEEGSDIIFVQESLFLELKKGAEMFESFVCDQDYIMSNRIKPGAEYNQAYIYFLIEDDIVVYVGQTVNLHSRLAAHASSKCFDSVAVHQVHKSFLNIAEQANIIHYNPSLNGTMWGPKSVFKRLLDLCDM